MARLNWILGPAIATAAAAWSISGLGQPLPGVPAPPADMRLAPLFMPAPPAFPGHPPPLPMAMAFADMGMPPPPPPFLPGPGGGDRFSAAESCLDMVARHAGVRAYLKARLNLSPQQLAAWQDFENAATESEPEDRQACAKLAGKPGDQTVVQRLDIAEEMLSRRLAQVRKVAGLLHQVIATLSPDQLRLLERSAPLLAF